MSENRVKDGALHFVRNQQQKQQNRMTLSFSSKCRVGVGSTNPCKVESVRKAFEKLGFTNVELVSLNAPSGVSDQPFSDQETIQGAINRARAVMESIPELDFAVGLEGGVIESSSRHGGETSASASSSELDCMFLTNWGAIVDVKGNVSVGAGHRVQVPVRVARELRKGRELAHVVDEWCNGSEIHKKQGTIGVLTNNLITRETMFSDVVICAFARFLFPEDYSE